MLIGRALPWYCRRPLMSLSAQRAVFLSIAGRGLAHVLSDGVTQAAQIRSTKLNQNQFAWSVGARRLPAARARL